jgi:simple sugar transport system permease protein
VTPAALRHPGAPLTRQKLAGSLGVAALYAGCLLTAVAVSAVLVSATGGSATRVLSAMLDGSIRSPGRWGATLLRAAPLLAVATGTIVATRAGLVNIGQEGQVLAGAAATAYAAVRIPGPGPLALVLAIALGLLAGAGWAGIAAVLRYARKVPEVITTLLLVFVAFHLVTYGLTRSWLLLDRERGGTGQLDTGEQLPAGTRLGGVDLFGNHLDLTVAIALAVAVAAWLALNHTVWGFRLQLLGQSPRAAQRSGVPAARAGSMALTVSGGLAGLAGSMMLAGSAANHRLTVGFSNNVGWEGLLVALLARSNPLAAIPMAVLLAGLRTGSGFLAATGVDRQIADVVQALLVLALLLPPALRVGLARHRPSGRPQAMGDL